MDQDPGAEEKKARAVEGKGASGEERHEKEKKPETSKTKNEKKKVREGECGGI